MSLLRINMTRGPATFEQYKKSNKLDAGKDYAYLICAYNAIKLCLSENVIKFKLTTNNKKFNDFDDISLETEFSDGTRNTFLCQLKYKKDKFFMVTDQKLQASNNEFSIEKCKQSFTASDNTFFILSTNAKYQHDTKKGPEDNMLSKCDYEFWMDVINLSQENCLFQIGNKIRSNYPDGFVKQFYLLTNQPDIDKLKSSIELIIHHMFKTNIHSKFMKFMKEWSLKEYVLTKDDVMAKLVELTLSPWIQTLTSESSNEKSKLVTDTVMKFDLTIINPKNDLINKIWNTSQDYNIAEVVRKYDINDNVHKEKTIALWYLNTVPLVVEVNKSNKGMCIEAVSFLCKYEGKRRIVLVGDINQKELTNFEGSVFENLSDLSVLFDLLKEDQKEITRIYKTIIRSFQVSLQGREEISLEVLLEKELRLKEEETKFQYKDIKCKEANNDKNEEKEKTDVEDFITINYLLNMTQGSVLLGDDITKEKLPNAYVSRSVSTYFLNTSKTIETFKNDAACLFIINCDASYKGTLQNQFNDVNFVETTDYLDGKFTEGSDQRKNNLILVSTQNKCTSVQFSEVCNTKFKKKSHVYLLQVVSEVDSILLLKLRRDNKLSAKHTMKVINYREKNLREEEIFKYLSNCLNIFIAPPGIGKSTLFTFLSQNCPPEFWCVRVNLLNHIRYLRTEARNEDILAHFLQLTEDKENLLLTNVKKNFLKKRKLYIFFDGLDEIDSTCVYFFLKFIKTISSEGIRVWVSSRENLRGKIMQILNVAPTAIQELTKEEQIQYIEERLKDVYNDEEIKKIITAIFRGKDIPSIEQLLRIPLQLYIITENFKENRTLFEKLEKENIFVLSKIYKTFFENKKKFQFEKADALKIEKQIGYHFESYLQNYEIPAVKAVLKNEDFKKLDLDTTKSNFLKHIEKEGDKFGIIKQVDKHKQAVYVHQTFAEYFACVWFSRNLGKMHLLKKEFLSEKYKNLRYLFDIMLAEENPLHLAIIYKNIELFNKYVEEDINKKDKGGRNALHLVSCYGNKYPVVDLRQYKSAGKETNDYVKMADKLIQHCNFLEKDRVFEFDCIQYAARSCCLYVIEKFLELKETVLDELYDVYESKVLLVYYCLELGYSNLLRAVITKDPNVLQFEKGYIPPLLKVAVMGSRETEDSEHNSPKEGNIETVKTLLEMRKQYNYSYQDSDNDALVLSCQNGWYDMIKLLLDHGVHCSGGNTVLHVIAKHGRMDEAAMLLAKDYNIDINAQNQKGETALHLTCQASVNINKETDAVEMLLRYGADINCLTQNNSTLLHYAANTCRDNSKVIRFLVNKGFKVDDQNNDGECSLYIACFRRSIFNVKTLLDKGANANAVAKVTTDIDPRLQEVMQKLLKLHSDSGSCPDTEYRGINGQTPLHIACEYGEFEIAELLLDRGADVNILTNSEDSFLHYMLKKKRASEDVIKLLLDRGISIDFRNKAGETALHIACESRLLNTVKILLDRGSDMNILTNNNESVLHYAAKSWICNSEIICLLVDSGIDINLQNSMGESALLLAWKEKSFGNVKALLGKSAEIRDILSQDEPLHFAVETSEDNSELINILIDHGVNVNAKNTKSETPLHIACEERCSGNVQTLIKRGADVNSVTSDGTSVLHYAVKTSYLNKEVIILLKDSVDVNASNLYGETALHISCKFKCTENVKTLLNHGAALNAVTKEKMNALHYAVMADGNLDIIRLLINRGIKLNTQDVKGRTPLHIACDRALYNVAKLLMGYNANVNLLTAEGKNILHYAAQSENYKLIETILNSNIDKKMFVDHLYKNNRTILHYAVLTNGTDDRLLNSFIDAGVDVYAKDIEGKNALDFAFENGCYSAVGLLLKTGLYTETVTSAGVTSLHYAVYSGCSSGVETFLQKCTDLNGLDIKNEDFPLFCATENGRLKRDLLLKLTNEIKQYISSRHSTNPVGSLLRRELNTENVAPGVYSGCDFHTLEVPYVSTIGTPLHLAAITGDMDKFKKLITSDGDFEVMDSNGWRPLHYAAEARHKELIDVLIKKAVDVNAVTNDGDTALHIACVNGHYEIAEQLIQSKADINALNKYQETSLHVAVNSGFENIAQLLVKEECTSIDAVNSFDETPLYIACREGNAKIVDCLVRDGKADSNFSKKNGRTPIFIACENGHREIVKLLIEFGAEVDRPTKDGWTSLHITCENGFEVVAELLIEAKSNVDAKTKKGATPIHIACLNGHCSIVKLLHNNGADIYTCDKKEETPLHICCQQGFPEIVEFILEVVDDQMIKMVTQKNREGWTPVHIAAYQGYVDIINIFIKKYDKQNELFTITTNSGCSSLHLACQNNCLEVVRLWLENFKNDMDATDNAGWTPLDYALFHEYKEIVSFFKTEATGSARGQSYTTFQ